MKHSHTRIYNEHRAPPTPRRHVTLWLLAADGREAHVYTYENNGTGQKRLILAGPPLYAPPITHQMGRHQLARIFESSGPMRHMSEPKTDVKREAQKHLMQDLAALLVEARRRHAFDELVIAAPAKVIGDLRLILPPEVRNHVTAEIVRDLVRFSPEELALYLRECHLA